MPRYLITLEYDGGGFVGWQRQDNGVSVQAAVEAAATAIIGGRAQVAVQGAGRTDAGVHALGQAAHFDLPPDLPPNNLPRAFKVDKLPLALNVHLPPSVRVLAAQEVAADFNARFDARKRVYRYRLWTRRIPPALERGRVWCVGDGLDRPAMEAAAAHLVGRHDFTSFRATQCQAASPVKTLDILCFEEEENGLALVAEARSFLHHQVRNIMGTLVEVGRKKYAPADVRDMLKARNRAAAGICAPAGGLYLMRVDYP